MANVLQPASLKSCCENILKDTIDDDTCLFYWTNLENISKPTAYACLRHVAKHFNTVTTSDAFYALDFIQIQNILECPELYKNMPAIEFLRTCKRWLTRNPQFEQLLVDLMKCLNMSCIHSEHLQGVLSWDITKRNVKFKRVVNAYLTDTRRISDGLPVLVGISNAKNGVYSLYDITNQRVLNEAFEPPDFIKKSLYMYVQMFRYGNILHFIGGRDSSCFFSFDIKEKYWRVLPDVPYKGNDKALFILDDALYTYIWDVAYKFDFSESSWQVLKQLPVNALGQAGQVLDGKAYVTGGVDQGTVYKCIHVYNKEDDTWSQKSDMVEGRYWHAMFGHSHKLYIFGGGKAKTLIECYDPTTDQSSVFNSKFPPTLNFDKKATQVYDGVIYIWNDDQSGADNTSLIECNLNENTTRTIHMFKYVKLYGSVFMPLIAEDKEIYSLISVLV